MAGYVARIGKTKSVSLADCCLEHRIIFKMGVVEVGCEDRRWTELDQNDMVQKGQQEDSFKRIN